jgi:YidC/Oxa1 family membrane protein insertase
MWQSIRYLVDLMRFSDLSRDDRQFVFYSQGAEDWVHLEPVIEALLRRIPGRICYVSSTSDDPGLSWNPGRIHGFAVGFGWIRTHLLNHLEADLLICTMPDLDTFHIKRSSRTGHYCYIHHSMISAHMGYRPGAFDHFDSIFCTGPHHLKEIRALEESRQTRPKRLVPHGYGRIDSLILAAGTRRDAPDPELDGPLTILVAPSWGKNGLLETCAEPLLKALLKMNSKVVVRPHPQTWKHAPEAIRLIRRWMVDHPCIHLEASVANLDSILDADLMITDWSGVGFEFALSRLKPAIFIDVPPKVNNPDYGLLDVEPLECTYREEVGRVVPIEALDELPRYIRSLLEEEGAFQSRIASFRDQALFNLGRSGEMGAQQLIEISRDLANAHE